MISTICSGCGKGLKAPDTFAGRRAACPSCGAIVSFQAAAPPSLLRADAAPSQLFENMDEQSASAASPTPAAGCIAPAAVPAVPASPVAPAGLNRRVLGLIGGSIIVLLTIVVILLIGRSPAPQPSGLAADPPATVAAPVAAAAQPVVAKPPSASSPVVPPPSVPAETAVGQVPGQTAIASRVIAIRSGPAIRPQLAPPGRMWVVLRLAAPSDPPYEAAHALRLRIEDGSEQAPRFLGSAGTHAMPMPGPPDGPLRQLAFTPVAEAGTAPATAVAFDVPVQSTSGRLADGQTVAWTAITMPGYGGQAQMPALRAQEAVPAVEAMPAVRFPVAGTLDRPLGLLADGRLALLLASPRGVTLFDPATNAFSAPILLPSDGTMVAAGGQRLVSYVPEIAGFRVNDLTSGKELAAFPCPMQAKALALGMARGVDDRFWADLKFADGSYGAAILATADGAVLERIERCYGAITTDPFGVRIADGFNTVIRSESGISPRIMVRGEGGWALDDARISNLGAVVPLPDGARLACMGAAQESGQRDAQRLDKLWLAPIAGVDAMLAIDPRNGAMAVHQFGREVQLLALGGIPGWQARRRGERMPAAFPERFCLDLERGRLLLVPPDDQAVLVAALPLAERLRQARVPHLLVRNPAPQPAVLGERWAHRLEAVTDQAGVSYRIERGPTGMTIDDKGQMSWLVPPRATGPARTVVEIKTAGASRLIELSVIPVRRVDGSTASVPRLPGMSADQDYLELGGKVVDVAEAQDGRYVVCSIGDRRALAIIDLVAGKEVAAIPWPGEKPPAFAAGGKLVAIASETGDAIDICELAGGRHVRRLQAPLPQPVFAMAMGMNRDDVVVCSARSDAAATLDLVATSDGRRIGMVIAGKDGKPVQDDLMQYGFWLRANEDATVICATRPQSSPTGRYVLVGRDGAWTMTYEHKDGADCWPVGPGELADRNAILGYNQKPIVAFSQDVFNFRLRPVAGAPMLLAIREDRVELFSRGGTAPLCDFGTIPRSPSAGLPDNRLASRRAFYSTKAGRGYIIPIGFPGIVVVNALRSADAPPVLATPSPMLFAPGKPLQAKLETLIADPSVRFSLESGPDGLAIDADGTLRWTPPADQRAEAEVRVGLAGRGGKAGARLSLAPRQLALADPASWETGAGGVLALGEGGHRVFADPGSKHALLVHRGELWSLDAATLRPLQRIAVDGDVLRAAVRGDEALVVYDGVLHVLSLPALKERRRFDLPSREVYDLAVVPGKRLSYVACRDPAIADRVLCRRVAQVNESTGKVQWLDKACGQMLAVTPDGRGLFTAVQEFISNSSTLVDQWGQRFIVTRTGNVALLVRYSISGASATPEQLHEDPGTDLVALHVSGDGRFVAPLSRGGYRRAGGGGFPIPMFNTADIGRCEFLINSEDRPAHLCFHPVLPLALAGSGERGGQMSAWLSNFATGKRRGGDLLKPGSLDELEQLLFSPDGTAAWLIGSRAGKRILLTVDLGLKDDELKQVSDWRRPKIGDADAADDRAATGKAAAAPAPAEPAMRIARSRLKAVVEPGGTAQIDTKELAKRSQDAVVLILQDQGSGSGFLVSNDGLVATCAHVLPTPGRPVRVQLRDPKRNQASTLNAVIVARDDRLDLALLKVDCPFPTPYVRFEYQLEPQMGEEVSVIGNPGMGQQVLIKSMTTGIISNPARELDGQPFLQTSAAVNPGCSGGPLFNARGNVIGMVTLKARIDATAFAIPRQVVVAFLESCCTPAKGR